MSQILNNLKVGLDEELKEVLERLHPQHSDYHILKKSIDARQRKNVHFVYSIEVFDQGESPKEQHYHLEKISKKPSPVLIIGAGPAGLFAAIRLLERGIPCLIFEQGDQAEKRLLKITRFWRYGELDPYNNVGFGEGGAGLYSDGKLITRVKSPYIPYVLRRFVDFGAPKEIEYLSNPHVGSDKIRRIIPKLRNYIESLGGEFHFNSPITQIYFENKNFKGVQTLGGDNYYGSQLILATGHSARQLFYHLHEQQVHMEAKPFAMGLRVEHPQQLINQIQYREAADHPKLKAANYKLTHHDKKENVGVYSFCMCPGGYVLSSGTEPGGLVSNGMSNYNRNSPFANSAIVVTVPVSESQNVFTGLQLQEQIEKEAYQRILKDGGQQELPAQRLVDFLKQKESASLPAHSCPSGALPSRLDQLFPTHLTQHLTKGLESFCNKLKGFHTESSLLFGVETRTSSPLRIVRDPKTLESVTHKGLYPTGEGAGYAGGITSAACDGVNVAEAIYQNLVSQKSVTTN